MINIDKISNFINNIEFISHNDYEKTLAQIFTEFKGDEWLSRVIVSYLLYEKFDKQYEVFIESTKDTLSYNRPFPNIKYENFTEIIENAKFYYEENPNLFKYIVPVHPFSLICLYKAQGVTHILEDYLQLLSDRPDYLTDELLKFNLFPEKLYGVITLKDNDNFSLNLNSEYYNSIFYKFKFNELDFRKDFIPKTALYSREVLNQEINYEFSTDKTYLHKPQEINLEGKMLPVVVKIKAGIVWFSLDIKEKHKVEIPIDVDIMEVIEGVVTMEALAFFKVVNLKESFVDAESISILIKNKKNKELKDIFSDYYNEKYDKYEEVKINGTEIYKSFINSDDFVIEKGEVQKFNRLIQEYNISADKAKFLLFYSRLKNEVPMIAKPIIEIKKLIKSIYPK